jgi:N,N'-diacetyllegionaminate synthase
MNTTKTYVIAEIANAHQGNLEVLLSLIEAAAIAGADAVKVQWYKYDYLAMPDYEWYRAYQDLFIEPELWGQALDRAAECKLDIWADIFDDWGVDLATKMKSRLKGVKLPPTVLEDDRLASAILRLRMPTLVGIGGWTEEQIVTRLRVLKRMARNELILMHGFQGYPTSPEDCNLSRIRHYLSTYACRVGIADHVDGGAAEAMDIPAYAVCAGATLVEKHLTLDRAAKGYDYFSSLDPDKFALMVTKLRRVEAALGSMARSENEHQYLAAAPRAVIKRSLAKGGLLSFDDLMFRRTSHQEALTPSHVRVHLPAVICREAAIGDTIAAQDLRKPKVVIAVICRLKSTRLKRKALAEIGGLASVLRCIRRCRQAASVSEVLLATSNLPDDDDLVSIATREKIRVVRGDPENVLNRLITVAEVSDADVVVRVTGDCPVVAPEILDFLVAHHLAHAADYTGLTGSFPVGLAGDVFSVVALRRLQLSNADPSLTEYLRYYFEWNRKTFRCQLPKSPRRWHGPYRLTLDVQEDLDMFNRLYDVVADQRITDSTTELLELLDRNPEISALNSHVGLVYKTDAELISRIRQAVKIRK